jgi:hypothetical protein
MKENEAGLEIRRRVDARGDLQSALWIFVVLMEANCGNAVSYGRRYGVLFEEVVIMISLQIACWDLQFKITQHILTNKFWVLLLQCGV